MGYVHPEAVHTTVEPEPQHLCEQLMDLRILPVPVGLGGVEDVQVPLTRSAVGFGDTRPGGAVEDRGPVVRRQLPALALAICEDVHLPLG